MANRLVLVTADHDAVAAMLRDRPDGFRRTERLEAVGLEMGLKGGLFGANGDLWKRQRRMVMAAFDPGHVKAYYPSLVRCGQRLAGRWDLGGQPPAPHRPAGRPDALHGRCHRRSGLRHRRQHAGVRRRHHPEPPGQDLPQAVHAHHLGRAVLALLQAAVRPRTGQALQAVDRAIAGFIATARQRLAADPARKASPQNLLEAMLVAADEPDSGIDDDQVAGNVLTMLLAGEDTTANTLAWCIWLLKQHPAALARATPKCAT
jgi:cytochrome P450